MRLEKIPLSPRASRAQMIPLLDRSDGFSSGGIHGEAWHQNVGKISNLPTLFDQGGVAQLERF